MSRICLSQDQTLEKFFCTYDHELPIKDQKTAFVWSRFAGYSTRDLIDLFSSKMPQHIQPPHQTTISWWVFDVRIDKHDKKPKILEFHTGHHCPLNDYMADGNHYSVFAYTEFWKSLQELRLPIFFVCHQKHDIYKKSALDVLKACGGQQFDLLTDFSNAHTTDREQLQGILVYRNFPTDETYKELYELKKLFPKLIIPCDISAQFTRNKAVTRLILERAGLSAYQPDFRICSKAFVDHHDITESAMRGETMIAKLFDGAWSKGAALFKAGSLEKTSARYKQLPEFFILEEYVESEPYVIANKAYDPTFKVLAIVHSHEDGSVSCKIWPLFSIFPKYSLDAAASEERKHISYSIHAQQPKIPVAQEDSEIIVKHLENVLPIAYQTMLELDAVLQENRRICEEPGFMHVNEP